MNKFFFHEKKSEHTNLKFKNMRVGIKYFELAAYYCLIFIIQIFFQLYNLIFIIEKYFIFKLDNFFK